MFAVLPSTGESEGCPGPAVTRPSPEGGTAMKFTGVTLAGAAAMAAFATAPAGAHRKLKIGIITTLTVSAGAVPGQQQRNGFQLGVKHLGGKRGGREVDLVVQDDELKPDLAVTKVKAMIERDKVDFVVGPIFSNILGAII